VEVAETVLDEWCFAIDAGANQEKELRGGYLMVIYCENEEFIWPEVYKAVGEEIANVGRTEIGALSECLEA
jgi:hypothetical protein